MCAWPQCGASEPECKECPVVDRHAALDKEFGAEMVGDAVAALVALRQYRRREKWPAWWSYQMWCFVEAAEGERAKFKRDTIREMREQSEARR